MRARKIGKPLSALIFLLAWAPLHAEPQINARVSSADITLSDSITLTVEISGVGNVSGAPALNISGFTVQRGGQTQSFQWINGQTSSLIAYNYILTPVNVGNFTIPAIVLEHEGKTYSTQPINLVVRATGNTTPAAAAGSQAPPSGSVDVPTEGLRPIFMTAKVDRSKAVVGEQILLTVQFLRRPQTRISGQPRYSEPDMTGFLVEPLKQQEYTTVLQGAQYNVNEIRYALFPTTDGEYAIGSATIDVPVQADVDPFDPNSFFQNFFGRQQLMKLNTRAIPIQVRALPKNKPANFSGAVGRFRVTSVLENPKVEPEVGKPINLVVTVQGVGNIKALKEPTLPEMSAFRRYDTITKSDASNEGKFIHGSKEFKILLIPQVSGPAVIPSVSYVFYNPDLNQFQTEMTREIPLQIKPGALNAAGQDAIPSIAQGQVTEGVRVLEKDIRFIKQGRLKPVRAPLLQRPSFYIFNSLPLLFGLGVVITRWRSQVRETHASLFRFRGARRGAQKRLKRARKLITEADPIAFYGALYEAIAGYIADKLGVSAHGLVWEEVDQRLRDRGVGDQLRYQLRIIKEEADMVRFATSEYTDEKKQISLSNTEKVLGDLEEVLS